MRESNDNTLQNLLDLHGEKFFIDEKLGVWVKFEAITVSNEAREFGLKYSLTLHNKTGERILGFDNAHEIEYGRKNKVPAKRTFDHCHIDGKKDIQPYLYTTAGKLIEDFWAAVEKKIQKMGGIT